MHEDNPTESTSLPQESPPDMPPENLEAETCPAEASDADVSFAGETEPIGEVVHVPEEASPEETVTTTGQFPTFIGGDLHHFRVSCDGHPTLEGKAIDESEAIRAYRMALGLDAKQYSQGAKVQSCEVERL